MLPYCKTRLSFARSGERAHAIRKEILHQAGTRIEAADPSGVSVPVVADVATLGIVLTALLGRYRVDDRAGVGIVALARGRDDDRLQTDLRVDDEPVDAYLEGN